MRKSLRVVAAPLEGVSDRALRALWHDLGVDLTTTERVHVSDLLNNDPVSWHKATPDVEFAPTIVQLSAPSTPGEAARLGDLWPHRAPLPTEFQFTLDMPGAALPWTHPFCTSFASALSSASCDAAASSAAPADTAAFSDALSRVEALNASAAALRARLGVPVSLKLRLPGRTPAARASAAALLLPRLRFDSVTVHAADTRAPAGASVAVAPLAAAAIRRLRAGSAASAAAETDELALASLAEHTGSGMASDVWPALAAARAAAVSSSSATATAATVTGAGAAFPRVRLNGALTTPAQIAAAVAAASDSSSSSSGGGVDGIVLGRALLLDPRAALTLRARGALALPSARGSHAYSAAAAAGSVWPLPPPLSADAAAAAGAAAAGPWAVPPPGRGAGAPFAVPGGYAIPSYATPGFTGPVTAEDAWRAVLHASVAAMTAPALVLAPSKPTVSLVTVIHEYMRHLLYYYSTDILAPPGYDTAGNTGGASATAHGPSADAPLYSGASVVPALRLLATVLRQVKTKIIEKSRSRRAEAAVAAAVGVAAPSPPALLSSEQPPVGNKAAAANAAAASAADAAAAAVNAAAGAPVSASRSGSGSGSGAGAGAATPTEASLVVLSPAEAAVAALDDDGLWSDALTRRARAAAVRRGKLFTIDADTVVATAAGADAGDGSPEAAAAAAAAAVGALRRLSAMPACQLQDLPRSLPPPPQQQQKQKQDKKQQQQLTGLTGATSTVSARSFALPAADSAAMAAAAAAAAAAVPPLWDDPEPWLARAHPSSRSLWALPPDAMRLWFHALGPDADEVLSLGASSLFADPYYDDVCAGTVQAVLAQTRTTLALETDALAAALGPAAAAALAAVAAGKRGRGAAQLTATPLTTAWAATDGSLDTLPFAYTYNFLLHLGRHLLAADADIAELYAAIAFRRLE